MLYYIQGLHPWPKCWKPLCLYLGPSSLAKVLETFVPKDDVILYLGPSPLAKVLETFVPKDDVVLYLGPSLLAKVYPWIL